MFTLTLSSFFGNPGRPVENWLHINVVINWQLSKQDIHRPVLPDHIPGSGRVVFDPISDRSVFVFYLTGCVGGLKSLMCISGLRCIIAAWRPILTQDKSRWRKYFTKTLILKKWAFQLWLLQPRYCHGVFATWILRVVCSKEGLPRGGHGHPRTPLATPLEW